MNVVFLAPGYPSEMPHFVRGLAEQGAHVIGLGDQPVSALPELARQQLSEYLHVPSIRDEMAVVGALTKFMRGRTVDRVVALWEPVVVLGARIREALGVPGIDLEMAHKFRDKDLMKQVIQAAGLRTARHARASTSAEVRAAVEKVGYPAIIKPIDGAGSMDTFRVDTPAQLEQALGRLKHVPEVNVEEFITGEEYHYDTICANGKVLYENMGFYRPKPLISRSNEWISPQTLAVRDLSQPHLQPGITLGREVLKVMGLQTGFTHMEWFLTPSGEAVFSEIAARPPGANTVDLMNFAADIDVFSGYAEAELKGTYTSGKPRTYNAINIFKRAEGQGRISRIEGMALLMERHGEHVVLVDLLPIGAQRRDWVQTLLSDGYVVIRHPDWDTACAIADDFGTDLRMFAN
ncbi:MAG: acetyl-CoA carboxylase biotin carboxylase subunit family protein [Gemmatimonadaceae bacterium]